MRLEINFKNLFFESLQCRLKMNLNIKRVGGFCPYLGGYIPLISFIFSALKGIGMTYKLLKTTIANPFDKLS
jgi:hypothetical protein